MRKGSKLSAGIKTNSCPLKVQLQFLSTWEVSMFEWKVTARTLGMNLMWNKQKAETGRLLDDYGDSPRKDRKVLR